MSALEATRIADRLLPSLMDGGWSRTQDEGYCALGELVEAHIRDPFNNPLPPAIQRWLDAALERDADGFEEAA